MATKAAKKDSRRNSHGRRKWSGAVNTESTYPGEGLFNKDTRFEEGFAEGPGFGNADADVLYQSCREELTGWSAEGVGAGEGVAA
jgi:hypothetical protein